MTSEKSSGALLSAGILSAITASLCCIAPVIALFAGTSSMAASFSWIAPLRPLLIVFSFAALGFAWYRKLKPAETNDRNCPCETNRKASFLQSKTFLGMVTLFALVMMAFPLYAKMLVPLPKVHQASLATSDHKRQVKFTIIGMTCTGCEVEVNNELSKVKGVMLYKTSYATRSSLVTFDPSKVDVKTIVATIDQTGYQVKSYEFIDASSE